MQDYSVSLPAMRSDRHAVDYENEEDDEENDGPDGEVRSKIRGKRTKKGQEVFQCEKCSKWYRHPACLIKHRWQHTEYWAQTSNLMMSKHQSVLMLEAAAILTNGSSLPEEKSFWPAAVSLPQSGLLGCETLNVETLRAARHPNSPQFGSSLQSLEPHSLQSTINDADDEDTSMMDDADDGRDSRSRSGEIDREVDEVAEGMFEFEMEDTPVHKSREEGSGPEDRDSGYASGDRDSSALATLSSYSSFRYPQYPRPPIQMPARLPPIPLLPHPAHVGTGFGAMSAPALGFFEPRAFGRSPIQRTVPEESSEY